MRSRSPRRTRRTRSSRRTRRTILTLPLALAAVAGLAACEADPEMAEPTAVELDERSARAAAVRTYEITIENLTSEGQPLTPPVVALHRGAVDLFQVGSPASEELKEIAENGNLAPMVDRLESDKHAPSVAVAATPPVPPLEPGESVTLELDAEPGARFLSFASMLICTNDGFTGASRVRLPHRIGEEWVGETDGYDAGTEVNTEDFSDIVPPCPALTGVETEDEGSGTSDPALAEDGVIHHHPGISGDADLDPELHGWDDPVARIVVRRTS